MNESLENKKCVKKEDDKDNLYIQKKRMKKSERLVTLYQIKLREEWRKKEKEWNFKGTRNIRSESVEKGEWMKV